MMMKKPFKNIQRWREIRKEDKCKQKVKQKGELSLGLMKSSDSNSFSKYQAVREIQAITKIHYGGFELLERVEEDAKNQIMEF